MMTVLFDLHTHTRYSRNAIHHHAKGTVFENAQTAAGKKIGLGITDHGPGHSIFGLRPREYARQKAEIDAVNRAFGYRIALLGVEANLMDVDGGTDIDLLPLKPDVCLMGYHKGVRMRGKAGRALLSPALIAPQKCKEAMTAAVIKALARYPIDVLTHPGEYVPVDMRRVAEAAARLGVVIELNNKHPLRGEDIAIALDKGAFFIISSDAHVPQNVGVVERAAGEARLAKIPKERIVNSGAYGFDRGLRIDRLGEWASELAHFSTGQK